MELVGILRQEACRRLEESRQRIHLCTARLNDEQLWHRPNGNVVSVGNLILHLTGNVGQWINSTLGGQPDHRYRDQEFSETGPVDRSALLGSLDRTVSQAMQLIRAMDHKQLEQGWHVQGFIETGAAILLHVVEHFSYHTGQITLHTKLLLDVDTGYYAGQDLNAKG